MPQLFAPGRGSGSGCTGQQQQLLAVALDDMGGPRAPSTSEERPAAR